MNYVTFLRFTYFALYVGNPINNFTNNKTITNAVVNHYNKTQDELNQEIITILKSENEQLKEQIVQKDKQINELIILSKR